MNLNIKTLDKNITLDSDQKEEGIFFILIPAIASLLPSLLGGKGVSRNNFLKKDILRCLKKIVLLVMFLHIIY